MEPLPVQWHGEDIRQMEVDTLRQGIDVALVVMELEKLIH